LRIIIHWFNLKEYNYQKRKQKLLIFYKPICVRMCTCVRMSNFNKKKKSLIKKINFEIVSKNLTTRFSAYISLYTSKVCTQANYVRVICFASLEKRLNPQSLQQESFEIARVKEIGKKRMQTIVSHSRRFGDEYRSDLSSTKNEK